VPELPEVETIKNCLLPELVGRSFAAVALPWPGVVRRPSAHEFCDRLPGQGIVDLRRRGKYMLWDLSGAEKLIIHLRMTGALLLQPAGCDIEPHTRAVLMLDDGRGVRFWDRRKLGAMWLVEDEAAVVGKLGMEPLSGEFTPEALEAALRRHSVPVKALLLDQNVIAGIGNMYADESLYAAGIDPLKQARDLTHEEVERLHRSVRDVLASAIGCGGASVDTYQQPDGKRGTAQFRFQVAHRAGERCHLCGTPIERVVVRGRGTCFCRRCQGPMSPISQPGRPR